MPLLVAQSLRAGDYAAALSHLKRLHQNWVRRWKHFKTCTTKLPIVSFNLKIMHLLWRHLELQLAQKPALSKAYQRDIHLRMGDAHFALAYWPAM